MLKRLLTSYPAWFIGFVALLAFAPLPFGSNRLWASAFCALATGGLLTLEILRPEIAESEHPLPLRRLFVAGGLWALVGVWALIQGSNLTPALWHHPLWAETGSLTETPSGSIALDPSAITPALLHLLTYVGFFLLALRTGRTPALGLALLKALAAIAGVYAAYGLIAQLFGGTTILWYKKWAYAGFLSSTFVNKNSYATYAGLGLMVSLGLVWHRVKHSQPHNAFLARKAKFAAFLDSLSARDAFVFLLPLVLLAALILSGSRAGFISALVGCVAFLLGLAVNRRWGGTKGLIGAGVLAAVLCVFLAVASQGLLFARAGGAQIDDDMALRLNAYKLEMRAISDNPLLGFGLGSFEPAFRLYRDSSMPLWFQHAHNDYLEAAMELGLPAALGLFGGIALVASCVVRGAFKRKRSEVFPLVAFSACLLVGFHSLLDFGLQIPAIAATFATLLGLGVSQSLSKKA